ncbi:hypothetical protein SAMN05216548_1315 [Faunimonas pinastri]|uniref:Uncharacterized protein n=1 Tax=Faunimonas pinastri TaxID=1855383 RepID=A0A1H9QQ14_9HYPH|nr:hypothetical protein [Faunimonas pinastri]SER61823.1 hypothetical protein SAMN05216548_1315 [Faunimonas pinastri]
MTTTNAVSVWIGDDWAFPIALQDSVGVAIDLTGFTVTGEFYRYGALEPVADLSIANGRVEILDSAAGAVILRLDRGLTTGVEPQDLDATIFPTRIRIILTDPDGYEHTVRILPILPIDPRSSSVVDLPASTTATVYILGPQGPKGDKGEDGDVNPASLQAVEDAQAARDAAGGSARDAAASNDAAGRGASAAAESASAAATSNRDAGDFADAAKGSAQAAAGSETASAENADAAGKSAIAAASSNDTASTAAQTATDKAAATVALEKAAANSATAAATSEKNAGSSATSAAKSAADAKAAVAGINAQSASYTLVAADVNKIVRMNAAAATVVTIPPDSVASFGDAATVYVCRAGAGAVTIAAGTGVTIDTPASMALRAVNSTVALVRIAANRWLAMGDLEIAA